MSLRLSIVNEENLLKYVTNKHDKKYSNKSKMDTQNLVDIIDYLNDNGVFADEENYLQKSERRRKFRYKAFFKVIRPICQNF